MIKQRILDHGIDGQIGDCYKTCIVNILDLPYESVPHFAEFGEAWWDRTMEWANSNGYTAYCYLPEGLKLVEGTLAIGTGKSPRGDWNHCVIIDHNLNTVFDPHPDDTGIETLIDVIVLVKD